MNRSGTKLDAGWGGSSPGRGWRALLWRWRWILLAGLLVTGPPTIALLLLYLTRFGIAWLALPTMCILLIALIVIGVQRENRRSRPIPPRPPGQESDEPIQAAESAPLNLRGRQAA